MNDLSIHKHELADIGFTTIKDIYTPEELDQILSVINLTDTSKPTFRKSADLFAIRQFLKEIPKIADLVFNNNLKNIIKDLFGTDYFIVKSIYFDKPETSNWFVSYHKDLTISVDKKIEIPDFGPWTVKHNQFAVQPPLEILENIFAIRIHLDDTDEKNGALKVIPKSHLKEIYRPETIDWNTETETFCNVLKGGIMIMKPLLMHGSDKTTNNKKRRIIHLEFSNMQLPESIHWAERQEYFK